MGILTAWMASLSALAFCAGAWATEVVTVAAEDDWAPYSSAEPGQAAPQGLAPRLVTAAFKTQGIEVRFLVVPFARCLHYAEKGTVAGCFDTTRTDANKDSFYWHSTPLFQEELAIFGRSEAPGHEMGQQDLEGHTVGVTIGYTYPTDFMENSRIARLSAASDSNLLKMLAARRVDYILLNTMPGYYRMRHEPGLHGQIKRLGAIRMDSFWLSFSRTHPDGKRLCDTFEKGLQAIRHSGEYDRMMAEFRKEFKP
jgi:polar amino acid transport system substrate-binding protein